MPLEMDAITPKKIAIVSGGSRGIGRNTVESLARRGVNAILRITLMAPTRRRSSPR
jgi:NAD(P)-dependent dehydrogenase (short-subunit alcohol dehydrogenase family)